MNIELNNILLIVGSALQNNSGFLWPLRKNSLQTLFYTNQIRDPRQLPVNSVTCILKQLAHDVFNWSFATFALSVKQTARCEDKKFAPSPVPPIISAVT